MESKAHTRIHISDLNEKLVGSSVNVKGWIDTIRAHGKLIFFDIRDVSGVLQCVVSAKNTILFEEAKKLTKESSVSLIGNISLRPKNTINEKISTGTIEMSVTHLEIYNLCPVLPFEFDNAEVGEEVRLKYRYLDLRRNNMKHNMIFRSKLMKAIRDYMYSQGFNEFETPMLAKSTPEGSRDYVVPSRVHAGKFYALPQSPQLFKQLFMVAGMEKYFQIARCMRDEDLRSDRQPEFTQLDVEMSFTDKEEIIFLMEGLIKKLWKDLLNVDIKTPFKRMTYADSMKKYNSDKPDLRKETGEKYAFLWVVDFPSFEYSEEDKRYVSTHHPFTMPNMEDFAKDKFKSRSEAYDIVLNGVEIGGGSIRIHDPKIQEKVFEVLALSKEEQREKFGFLLDALSYGAPPHGGIALGLDRLLQLMLEVESIREVIAFPKNSDARDVMLDSPSELSKKQLDEVHIKLELPAKKNKK
ncbi:aspartate--tRNA ligase [Candidatus Pacearchaeota archaeon]|nr:aspartate--tRNA ligase [Candidatus Pacearchaeota archaeon]